MFPTERTRFPPSLRILSENYATSSISVTVDNGTPVVSVTAPSSGATVSGSSVILNASASDDTAISSVQFQIDGSNLGASITSAPYTKTWDSTGVSDGTHTVKAIATSTWNTNEAADSKLLVGTTSSYGTSYYSPLS